MKELIFDVILFCLIIFCVQQITYNRHRVSMNIMAVQGLQYQIDDINKKLEQK